MYNCIKSGFKTNPIGDSLLREFAINHVTSDIVTVQTVLNETLLLNVTVLANKNELLFSVYSVVSHKMVDVEIDLIELNNALLRLGLRFEHALTRKPPKVNKELGLIWSEYLKQNPEMYRIDI